MATYAHKQHRRTLRSNAREHVSQQGQEADGVVEREL
jgi:hypothetical protein